MKRIGPKTGWLIMGTAIVSCVYRQLSHHITDVELPVANEVEVLGVVLDLRLTFDKHVLAVTRSCSFHAQATRHRRHLLSPSFLVPGPAQLPGGSRYRLFQRPPEWRYQLRIVNCICWSCWWRQKWLQLLYPWLCCWRGHRHTCPGLWRPCQRLAPRPRQDCGAVVTLLGVRLPFCRRRPTGSLTDGICALFMARQMITLRCEWRCCLGALFRQASPWSPRASTTFPQPHVCDSHAFQPSLWATDILSSVSESINRYFSVRLKVDQTAGQLSLPHVGKLKQNNRTNSLRKTDEQISPVNGLEPWDQSDWQKQTKVDDKIFWKGRFWAQNETVKSDGSW